MILNGKQINDWDEHDLLVLLDNIDYKESETIDYKLNFAFLEADDKKIIQHKKDEFRHDICSFANANGGYMFFGINEDNGVATSIPGLSLVNSNTDAFECKLKDIISTIQPVVPFYLLRFFSLNNGNYVVVLRINRGNYKPYVNKENDYFKYYIRRGNGKVCMNYEEVKVMFNKSMELAYQIDDFRKKRIRMCTNKEGVASSMNSDAFALIHFIPDSAFTYINQINPVMAWMNREINFLQIFSQNAHGQGIPNIDGLVFNYSIYDKSDKRYLQIFKNGAIEKFITIEKFTPGENSRLGIGSLCNEIRSLYAEAIRYYKTLGYNSSLYVGLTIMNCKGCCSELDFERDYIGIIDRDEIICAPFEISDIYNEEQVENMIKSILHDLCFSLGRRNVKEI